MPQVNHIQESNMEHMTSLGEALQDAFSHLSKKKQLDLIKEEAYHKFEVLRKFKPLALGMDKELASALKKHNPDLIARFLAIHCRNSRYLKNLAAGGKRFNLKGKVQGEVTAAEQEHARCHPLLVNSAATAKKKEDSPAAQNAATIEPLSKA